jgi:hypothetical protein
MAMNATVQKLYRQTRARNRRRNKMNWATKMYRALKVIVENEKIANYLNENDPKAWEQILDALEMEQTVSEADLILMRALVAIEKSGWVDNGGSDCRRIARKALDDFNELVGKENATTSEPIENSGLEYEGYFIKGPFWSDEVFGYYCMVQDRGGFAEVTTEVVATEEEAIEEAEALIDKLRRGMEAKNEEEE